MLSEGSQGCSSTWLWIAVGDADALHQELLQRGADIRHPPTNFPWGSREVHVFDPDRHVLRFGSEAPEDAPLGPWLDEAGVLWMPESDASWRRMESNEGAQAGPTQRTNFELVSPQLADHLGKRRMTQTMR
jgi:hypothetical protein